MHALEDAWRLLEPWLAPLPAENVARAEALGRVLAQSPRATVDVPPSDVSAMDGYALAGELALGCEHAVVATVAAGDPPGLALAAGTVARIMTGAPLPAGADRVLPVEQTTGDGARVTLHTAAAPGAHIRRRAEVQAVGDALLEPGAALTPASLALLAAQGVARVAVHGLPRVATLSTGNELVSPDAVPLAGQIRDSHSDFLLAAGRELGLRFTALGIVRDEAAALRAAFQRGFVFDVLLVSGGVSMGAYDLVEPALAALGAEVVFDGVAIQPGRPLVALRHSGGLVFGLPGNPASAMVCFALFVRPALERLCGLPASPTRRALTAELVNDLPAGLVDRDRFLPAEITTDGGRLLVRTFPPRGSHDVATFARGNALVRVRAGTKAGRAGDPIEALPTSEFC